jgi:hypothetical protein
MENQEKYISGKGKESTLPPELKGWNWGAFFLNWIWGIGNGTYIALLMFVPFVNFVMPFILGAKGNEWAWRNKQWNDVNHFKAVQKKWSLASLSLFVVVLPLFFILIFSMLKGEAYNQSLIKIKENAEVIALVGEPIEPDYFISGNINTSGPNGQAALKYSISGPNGSADVYLYATKHMESWNLDQLSVNSEEKHKKINIITREP